MYADDGRTNSSCTRIARFRHFYAFWLLFFLLFFFLFVVFPSSTIMDPIWIAQIGNWISLGSNEKLLIMSRVRGFAYPVPLAF